MTHRSKTALITGVTGQTGSYLAAQLISKGYQVHGGSRSDTPNLWRLEHLGIADKLTLHTLTSDNAQKVQELAQQHFDHIYHMAAESSVAASLKHPSQTVRANILNTTLWLEALRDLSPSTHFFNACTSEVFAATGTPITESSPLLATNPYAVTKLAAMEMCKVFRKSYGLFIVNGYLFNHESELRDTRFVTAKIVSNLQRMSLTKSAPPFELGNLLAERDFSHAQDFARGIVASLEHSCPSDYVFASGKLMTVRDFFNLAAIEAGFEPEWQGSGMDAVCLDSKTGRKLASINPQFYRPVDEAGKQGTAKHAHSTLGWHPEITTPELLARMSAYHRTHLST